MYLKKAIEEYTIILWLILNVSGSSSGSIQEDEALPHSENFEMEKAFFTKLAKVLAKCNVNARPRDVEIRFLNALQYLAAKYSIQTEVKAIFQKVSHTHLHS